MKEGEFLLGETIDSIRSDESMTQFRSADPKDRDVFLTQLEATLRKYRGENRRLKTIERNHKNGQV